MKISLLGGTGLLGTRVAGLLVKERIDHVVAGRSAAGPRSVRIDIATGEGVHEAVDGCDTVMLLSSNPLKTKKVDIGGARLLLPLIGDRHLIFMSIVGVDRHPFPFYRAKYEVEQMIEQSGVDYSILRATQFHDFVAYILSKVTKPPICLVPRDFVMQPVDTDEVAMHLVDVAKSGPAGMLPDLAGPEIIPIELLARTYMTAIGKERPIARLPIPGKVSRAFRNGVNTNPDRAVGKVTWADYLSRSNPLVYRSP